MHRWPYVIGKMLLRRAGFTEQLLFGYRGYAEHIKPIARGYPRRGIQSGPLTPCVTLVLTAGLRAASLTAKAGQQHRDISISFESFGLSGGRDAPAMIAAIIGSSQAAVGTGQSAGVTGAEHRLAGVWPDASTIPSVAREAGRGGRTGHAVCRFCPQPTERGLSRHGPSAG